MQFRSICLILCFCKFLVLSQNYVKLLPWPMMLVGWKGNWLFWARYYSALSNYWDNWVCTPAPWIWNDIMTMMLNCRLSALIWGYFHPYWVNHLEITSLFVHSPSILGDQKYLDKLFYMCIKVVKSLECCPIFLAHNDYIKLVTLQTFLDAFAVCFGCVSDYFVTNKLFTINFYCVMLESLLW